MGWCRLASRRQVDYNKPLKPPLPIKKFFIMYIYIYICDYTYIYIYMISILNYMICACVYHIHIRHLYVPGQDDFALVLLEDANEQIYITDEILRHWRSTPAWPSASNSGIQPSNPTVYNCTYIHMCKYIHTHVFMMYNCTYIYVCIYIQRYLWRIIVHTKEYIYIYIHKYLWCIIVHTHMHIYI